MLSWVASAWLALVLAFAPADAASTTPTDEAERTMVSVVLVGTPEDRAAVGEVLAELLGRMDVQLQLVDRDVLDAEEVVRAFDPAAHDEVLATVVVDLQTTTGLLYVLDATADRILVRRIALDAGVDEIAREEIGAITAEAIDALRAGGTIGVARAEVLPPEPEPAEPEPPPVVEPPAPDPVAPTRAPAPAPRRWPDTLAATADYRLIAWAPAALQHRVEGRVTLTGRTRVVQPRLDLTVGAWLPARVGPASEGVRIVGASLRAAAGLDVRLGRVTTLVGAVGAGIDPVGIRSRASARTRWLSVPTIDARVGAAWWLRPGLTLGLAAVAVVDLVDVRILAIEDDRVLFDPWRVWPGLEISIGGFAALIDRRAEVPPRT